MNNLKLLLYVCTTIILLLFFINYRMLYSGCEIISLILLLIATMILWLLLLYLKYQLILNKGISNIRSELVLQTIMVVLVSVQTFRIYLFKHDNIIFNILVVMLMVLILSLPFITYRAWIRWKKSINKSVSE